MRLLASLREWLSRNDSGRVPGKVTAQANTAFSFLQRAEYLKARQVLLKALERRDEIQDLTILNWLVEVLWWTWTYTEEYRDAAEFFSTYLQKYPRDVRARNLRASSLWYSGDLCPAIDEYSRALQLAPEDILAHLGRGQVLAESGEFSRAIEDLDFVHDHLGQVGLADPSCKTQVQAYAFSGRAFACAGLGDYERALSEFDRSVFLCPDNAFVYFNRAVVNENKGRLADASAEYKISLQKNTPKLTALKRKYTEIKVKTIG